MFRLEEDHLKKYAFKTTTQEGTLIAGSFSVQEGKISQ